MKPLRYSVFAQMRRSPLHAKWALENESADTAAMRLGRLAHALALGTPIGPVYEGERRGKAWTAFKEANAGQDIVTSDEFDTATAMAAALNAHDEASRLLAGIREKTLLFDYAGRPCRVTPDVFRVDGWTELKSTTDANPARFAYHALKMGYHAQMAWQQDGIERAGYHRPEEGFIVAVETKPPYGVSVLGVTPKALELGRRLYVSWLEAFLNCERSDSWGGYGPGVLDAPEDEFMLEGLEEVDA